MDLFLVLLMHYLVTVGTKNGIQHKNKDFPQHVLMVLNY